MDLAREQLNAGSDGSGANPIPFTRNFLAPMAAILASSILSLIVAVAWLVVSQNEMSARREQQVVRAAVGAKVDFLRGLNHEYSVWNDAVEHVILRHDPRWLDDQIGNYLYLQRGIERVYVLDQTGAAVYGRSEGKPAAPTRVGALGSGLGKAFGDLTSKRLLGYAQLGGTTTIAGEPAIFSLSRIRPEKETLGATRAQPRYLLLIKHIDDDVVAELAETAQLPTLTVSLWPAGRDSAGAQTLTAYDGSPVAYLAWHPQSPGSALARALIPVLCGISAAMIYLGIVVMRHARLGVQQLEISEAKANYMANRDMLTGLPNRRAFFSHLTRISARGLDYSIIYLDLDGFKEINDIFGHSTGDALLRHTSARLLDLFPSSDGFLARLGGDEFAIVLARHFSRPELDGLAQRIILGVRQHHDLGTQTIMIGVSIGIALSEGMEFEDVLRRADVAMYSAKSQGRDRWCVYDASLDAGRAERRALEVDLRSAVQNDQIFLEFQPIVRAGDNQATIRCRKWKYWRAGTTRSGAGSRPTSSSRSQRKRA